jgi:hypothetical protein
MALLSTLGILGLVVPTPVERLYETWRPVIK